MNARHLPFVQPNLTKHDMTTMLVELTMRPHATPNLQIADAIIRHLPARARPSAFLNTVSKPCQAVTVGLGVHGQALNSVRGFFHKQLTSDETTNNMRLKPEWWNSDEDVGSLGIRFMRSRKRGCGKAWTIDRHNNTAMQEVHAMPSLCKESSGLGRSIARGGLFPGRLLHTDGVLLLLAEAHLAA
jgi:hypothetical protein